MKTLAIALRIEVKWFVAERFLNYVFPFRQVKKGPVFLAKYELIPGSSRCGVEGPNLNAIRNRQPF